MHSHTKNPVWPAWTVATILALAAGAFAPARSCADFEQIWTASSTPNSGNDKGVPLSAEADFTVGSDGTITIVLTNTENAATFNTQGAALSGITFTTTPSSSSSSVGLTSVAGNVVEVNPDGTITDSGTETVKQGSQDVVYNLGSQTFSGSTVTANSHWDETSSPSGTTALSGMKPNHMILPSGTSFPDFSNTNFDPYFQGSVTFVLSGFPQGITAIDSVTFQFGTGPDATPAGTGGPVVNPTGGVVPVPSSSILFGVGALSLIGFAGFRRFRRLPVAG